MNNQTINIKTLNAKPVTHNVSWFAIYTKPRFEKKVELVLREAGYKVYLPLMSTIRQWSDRKKKVQVPLIPSYIFVNLEEKHLNELFQFNGVTGVLKYLRKPAVVQDFEIDNLKIICQHPDVMETVDEAQFSKGMTVQITRGPMIGLYGDCIEVNGKQRLLVSVKNLGLEFVLNVPLSYIEVVKNKV
jgi:transcription antitermination factor NusG